MGNRIFVLAVVLLWTGSMSWLLVDKVLPSWDDAEPPLPAGFEPNVPVAWNVLWSGRPVGTAATMRRPGAQNTTNIESRVKLADVPILDLAPPWMRSVVGDIGKLKFNSRTTLEFDSLDNFSGLDSSVTVNDVPGVLHMDGKVVGSFLELSIRSGELSYTLKVPAPEQSAVREALFPDAKLPSMYVGRRWHEDAYSPFGSLSDPVETIEAEVTGVESMQVDGDSVRVMRVEFVGPPGPGIPEEARLRAIAWVRPADGVVMRQDVILGNSKLRFERILGAEAIEIGQELLSPPGMHGRRARSGRIGFRGLQTPDAHPPAEVVH